MARADRGAAICFRCQRPIPWGRKVRREDGEVYHLNCHPSWMDDEERPPGDF